MKRISIRKIDEIISLLESIEKNGVSTEYYKNNAIAYLKNYADTVEALGLKTLVIKGNEHERGE